MGTHSRKTPADPNLALRIEVALRRKGLTATDLAAEVGRTVGAVSHWINGRFEPPRQVIPKLAETLGVSIEWLMGKSLTDAEKQAERRYLQLIVEGGNDLADLLEAIPLKDLISHLRKYKRDKRRAPRGD